MKYSMKKIIALLTTMVLILGCVGSYADTAVILADNAVSTLNSADNENEYTESISEDNGILCVGGSDSYGNENVVYLEFVAEKTGVLGLDFFASNGGSSYDGTYTSGEVTLLNSNKKAISNCCAYDASSSSKFFGVKKGTTYYLRTTSDDAYYVVKYIIDPVSDLAISSKSKAKTLKKGAAATKTLFVASTGSSTDWYKFKVSKTGTAKFTIDAGLASDGGFFTVTVYCGSKKIGSTKMTIDGTKCETFTVTNSSSQGKAKAGTYYVKVTKSAMANGKYTIKYK